MEDSAYWVLVYLAGFLMGMAAGEAKEKRKNSKKCSDDPLPMVPPKSDKSGGYTG